MTFCNALFASDRSIKSKWEGKCRATKDAEHPCFSALTDLLLTQRALKRTAGDGKHTQAPWQLLSVSHLSVTIQQSQENREGHSCRLCGCYNLKLIFLNRGGGNTVAGLRREDLHRRKVVTVRTKV